MCGGGTCARLRRPARHGATTCIPSSTARPRRRMIPASRPRAQGTATSSDGTRIAWYRYGRGRAGRCVRADLEHRRCACRRAPGRGSRGACHRRHLRPAGAGASERPEHGYDFPLHAADALAVLEAMGIGRAALVTASRGFNAALLLVAGDPTRFDRVAAVAPYMQLEAEPDPPDPEWLESLRCEADAAVPLGSPSASSPRCRTAARGDPARRPPARHPHPGARRPAALDFLLDP